MASRRADDPLEWSFREAAGLTETELSQELGWSTTTISRAELGHLHLSEVDVIIYLAFCGVYGIYGAELHACAAKPSPGSATSCADTDPVYPYDDIELAVLVRTDRQQVLHRPHPALFTFFVHERLFGRWSAIRRSCTTKCRSRCCLTDCRR
ncbi:helix-turn-helix domain-containing protein [Actinophytocola sp.]|uniref:helix-turn-helix domain-containing protein n=1 Tax=Actinophytocola sp. TaxID=1872138 RepID=UPI002DDC9699|nr:helix-turn-helix domain-containing protein [Actinophytocola sp.]